MHIIKFGSGFGILDGEAAIPMSKKRFSDVISGAMSIETALAYPESSFVYEDGAWEYREASPPGPYYESKLIVDVSPMANHRMISPNARVNIPGIGLGEHIDNARRAYIKYVMNGDCLEFMQYEGELGMANMWGRTWNAQ